MNLIAFRSTAQATLILSLVAALSHREAHGQQFFLSEKGKKQPAIVCLAELDHFDGNNLWFKQSNLPQGFAGCGIQQPISAISWKIQIKKSIDPAPIQPPGPSPYVLSEKGPNVIDPGRFTNSIGADSKDVDLQRADLQNAQNQKTNGSSQTPTDIDLTSCKRRGTDFVETTVTGSTVTVVGIITGISGGWVYVQKTGQSQSQKFRMLDVTGIIIGGC